MKPHKHAELIKAWADGAEIQYKNSLGLWTEFMNNYTLWNENDEYRIKPEPNPVTVKQWMYIYNNPSEGKTWISPDKINEAPSIYCQYVGKIEVLK